MVYNLATHGTLSLFLVVLLILVGCVSIPPDTVLVDRGGQAGQPDGHCAAIDFPPSSRPSRAGLDPGGFGLLSWNLRRGSEAGLEAMLQELASGQDLLAAKRNRLLTELTYKLGLRAVRFTDGNRVRVWNYPLDHIFYRGLRVLSSSSVQQDRSDHNPLLVRFAVD